MPLYREIMFNVAGEDTESPYDPVDIFYRDNSVHDIAIREKNQIGFESDYDLRVGDVKAYTPKLYRTPDPRLAITELVFGEMHVSGVTDGYTPYLAGINLDRGTLRDDKRSQEKLSQLTSPMITATILSGDEFEGTLPVIEHTVESWRQINRRLQAAAYMIDAARPSGMKVSQQS